VSIPWMSGAEKYTVRAPAMAVSALAKLYANAFLFVRPP
jgi:hypothetical protein